MAVIDTRIQNKLDNYSQWSASNIELLPGEIAIVKVVDDITDEKTGEVVIKAPAVLMKIGDLDENGNSKAFNALPWLSAKASDVYDWAKQRNKPSYSLKELGAEASGAVAQHDESSNSHSDIRASISELGTAIGDKADKSHGLHVTFEGSNFKPLPNNGTGNAGTTTTVSRSDHVHPIDISRAAQSDFSSHINNANIHFTAPERTKLSGIESGAQVNSITGVKGNSESSYRTGNVNITKANIGLGNVDNTADSNKTVKHASTSDSATKATQDASSNIITSTYETKSDATIKLNEAKTYTDDAVNTLNTVIGTKADKSHLHSVSDLTDTLLIEQGGTGATTAGGALKNLGILKDNGGVKIGTGAAAGSGGAVGNGASASSGGAVGNGASAITGGAVGAQAQSDSGGAVGEGAYSEKGGAVGEGTFSGDGFAGGYCAFTGSTHGDDNEALHGTGGAVGFYATSGEGFAGGCCAFTGTKDPAGDITSYGLGGAVGYYASANRGGAVGSEATSGNGGAIGKKATSTTGFAGGMLAKATADGAVQLGTGTNGTANTLQFIDHKISNGSGTLYGTVQSSGADTAEQFEWADSNINNEDRRGYFVTVDTGEKIRIANSNDDYILGVISSKDISSFISNTAYDGWHNKYLRDVYGDYILEEKLIPEEKDEITGEIIITEHTEIVRVINPEYDKSREYISRIDRPEWAVVCFMGQIVVNDDGTCKVNEYCKVSDNGGATAAEKSDPIKYRVIKRIDDSHVKIIFK